MNIRRVNNISYNAQKPYPLNQISFGQGRVNAYFDFDNTYCPASHSKLKQMAPSSHPWFVNYCESLKNFFNNTRKGLSFHITTGRTLGEYDAVSHLIRMRGFELPLPDSVIVKNGSDEYIKQAPDAEFYQGGKFPFSPKKRNIQKEEDIKALTGWNGQKIKEGLKKIFARHDLRIVEGDSEHGVGDYGFRSLFFDGKLRYEDKLQVEYGMNPTSDWNVGLRDDGNCKIFYTLPYDMNYCPERISARGAIDREIDALLNEIGARVHKYAHENPHECGGRPVKVIEPMVDENMKWHASSEVDQGLSKLYDVCLAVKRAAVDNDLVIAAGDGSNDRIMLNPLMYINIDENRFPEIANKYRKNDSVIPICEMLKQDPEKYKDIICQLENLPFIGIVVKNDEKNTSLSDIIEAFGKNSRYQKIIEIENGHLEDGIKEAIRLHSSRKPEYMQKLSPDLRREIFGIVDKGGGGKKS